MADIPGSLREAYHERCNVGGAPLEDLVQDLAPEYAADTLLALVDEVEEKVLESIGLMVQERPEMESMAESRVQQTRTRMDRLRVWIREKA